eukprot:107783_1
MLSRSNSQLNVKAQTPSVTIRRRILFGTICVILILLIFHINLLSMNLKHHDEDTMLLIGNDQDLVVQPPNPETRETVQDVNIFAPMVAVKTESNESEDAPDVNETADWDRELRWYHEIEFQQSMFDVKWHKLLHNETDNTIAQHIHSNLCDQMDYILDTQLLEHTYNLHALHPNFDQIDLIPLPRKFVLYDKSVTIGAKQLTFECNMMDNEMIQHAIDRYIPLMFDHRIDFDEDMLLQYHFINVEIHITNTHITKLRQDTDESYRIFIPFTSQCHTIHITSDTVFGALHAMETLSQLIEYDFDINLYHIKYVGYIHDYPYYKYRGVSLDTARHFYPVKSIKKFIDSIVYTKFNVFHWHIVDDQSWPYPLKTYPALYTNASWSKQERYSLNDVLDIISYAKRRGLRVIPEFDSPAHVGSLCKVFDICMDQFCTRSSSGLLDPTKPDSLEVIYNIYREIMEIFDDEYIHIGHDEADYKKCFKRNMKLKQWARENVAPGKKRSKKELGVYYYFLEKTYDFIKTETNKTMIAWDDIWFRLRKKYEIPNDIILMFWRQAWKEKLYEMMDMDFKVIMTEPFYIDLTYNDLKRRYYWDIWMVEDEKKKGNDYKEWWRRNILGGQACVWSERIDISVLDAKLFPDLSAIAENLWIGGEYVKYHNWNNVKKRLKWHRCLLLRRGIGGSPIDAKRTTLYRRQPDNPGSCYRQ